MAKYKLCAVTINSSDEIDIFKQYLSPQDFDFVELVPLSVKSLPNNTHWFMSACQRQYQCDVLVISGHFGGLFFGKKHNYILPVSMMQRQSCTRSCQGILSRVKEVFLFGCNTLADKSPGTRTPEQYASILINEYHMITDMAQMVSAAKYLPFGLSFEEQMQMVFSGPQTTIYGFNSLSPLGENIHSLLHSYFQSINQQYGSYKNYLDQRDPNAFNPFYRYALGGSAKEIKSLSSSHPNFKKFQKICPLYVSSLSDTDGLRTIESLLHAGDGAKAYTAIKSFVLEHRPFKGTALGIFNDIKNNNTFKSEFTGLYNRISPFLPYIKIQFLNFLHSFNWVTNNFYWSELRKHTLHTVMQSTSESYDFLSALMYNEHVPLPGLGLTSDDFQTRFYQNIWSALILEIFNITDYRAHRRLMNICISKVSQDPVVCYQVMKSLGHLNVSDSAIINRMVYFLKNTPEHYGLVWYALYGLAYSRVKDSSINRLIAHYVYNSQSHTDNGQWVQLQAIKTLHFLQAQEPEVGQQLVRVVQTSTDAEILLSALQALYQIRNPPLRVLRQAIVRRRLNIHRNQNIQQLAQCFLSGSC